MTGNSNILPLLAGAVVVLVALALLRRQYKRCPEGQLLVIYGARLPDCCVVIDSGGRFVLPVIQEVAYLSLEEMELPEHRQAGYPRAVRIGSSAALRRSAAIQLLGLSRHEIVAKAQAVLDEPASRASAQSLRERLADLGLEIA